MMLHTSHLHLQPGGLLCRAASSTQPRNSYNNGGFGSTTAAGLTAAEPHGATGGGTARCDAGKAVLGEVFIPAALLLLAYLACCILCPGTQQSCTTNDFGSEVWTELMRFQYAGTVFRQQLQYPVCLQALSSAADLRALAGTCRFLRKLSGDVAPGLKLRLFKHQVNLHYERL